MHRTESKPTGGRTHTTKRLPAPRPAPPLVRIRSVADLPEFSTRQQLSECLQVSVQTLARWATEGKGPKVTKFGGAARYVRDDVAAWVRAQREDAA